METESERSRATDDSESRRQGAEESRRQTSRPDRERDDDQGAKDQGSRVRAEKAAKEAVKLKEQNARLRKLSLDRQIAESKDDREEIARLDSRIEAVERDREQVARKVAEELDAGFLIRNLSDLTDRMGKDHPETLDFFEEAWLNQEKAAIAGQNQEKYQVIQAVDGLIERRRAALVQAGGLPQLAGLGEINLERELAELTKNLTEEEKVFLMRYYSRQFERGADRQASQAEWGERDAKQQHDWMDERIYELRTISLDPAMLTYSHLWQELIIRLSDEKTDPGVRDKFRAHLNLLKFNLNVRKLQDANLDIRTLTPGLELLDKFSLHELFKSPEIQTAYDLLERSGRTLEVTSTSALENLLITDEKKGKDRIVEESLVAQYLKTRNIEITPEELELEKLKNLSQEKQDAIKEAKSALYEAFDLYYFFGSFQAIEHSAMKPDSVGKVLNVTHWMNGKFRSPFLEVYGRERFYRKENGRLVTVIGTEAGDRKSDEWKRRARERQMVGLGNNKPLHQLFNSLGAKDFKEMGFKRRKGPEEAREIYDYRGRECVNYDPDKKKEKIKGTIIYERGEGENKEEIEVIFRPPGVGGGGELVTVRVANIKAETLGEAFNRDKIGENWIGAYCKFNLGYAENTRQTALKNGLWKAPVGSGERDLQDPLVRLEKAVDSGEFLQNMGWRKIDKRIQPYEIAGEDMNELYLKACLEWSKTDGKDNFNFIIGGDSLRSVILNEAGIRGLIEESGEDRLTDEFFGDYLRRYLRRTIAQWPLVAATRYPGMKGHMVGALWEAIKNFFSSYVFEGTPMEGAGGKPKPKR